MFDKEFLKNKLLNVVGPDYNIVFKNNSKDSILTIAFIDEDTNGKVNFKFDPSNDMLFVSPKDMEKEEYIYSLKNEFENIKKVLCDYNHSFKQN